MRDQGISGMALVRPSVLVAPCFKGIEDLLAWQRGPAGLAKRTARMVSVIGPLFRQVCAYCSYSMYSNVAMHFTSCMPLSPPPP